MTAARETMRLLRSYCALKPDPGLEYMRRPFAIGAMAYATDRHICIRVPLGQLKVAPKLGKPASSSQFDRAQAAAVLAPLPAIQIPAPCWWCTGTGREGRRVCSKCYGRKEDMSGIGETVQIDHTLFALSYIAQIAKLPDVLFGATGPDTAAAFSFTGGAGMLMPLKVWS